MSTKVLFTSRIFWLSVVKICHQLKMGAGKGGIFID